jgi:hypothetical protein
VRGKNLTGPVFLAEMATELYSQQQAGHSVAPA